ncbi:dihydrofolate reductase [Actinobacillus equuli]|nr:dihydrofolate reductase [Actinobacillus equuli]
MAFTGRFGVVSSNTVGKPVIMGRKTYESIGRLLPKRPNIIYLVPAFQ